MKKLYRSDTDKVFFGVLGGLGEYLKSDPIIVRLVFGAFTILTAVIPGVVVYTIAWFFLPTKG